MTWAEYRKIEEEFFNTSTPCDNANPCRALCANCTGHGRELCDQLCSIDVKELTYHED